MSKYNEDQLKRITTNIKKACIREYGRTEEAAKQFWYRLIHEVYKINPEAVPVMIQAQPHPANKEYMQSIYDELKKEEEKCRFQET